MIPLTDEQQKEYDNAKTCWICQKGEFINKLINILSFIFLGDFTPESDFLPTKWKKTKTPSKDDVHHLDNLAPYLEDCGIDTSNIPTIEVETILMIIATLHICIFRLLKKPSGKG